MSHVLPIVEVDEPLRGYKFAEVRGVQSPAVFPSGRYWRRGYEHRDTTAAVCHRRGHQAPYVDCSCGFHAVAELRQLPEVTEHHQRSVVLEVELGGTVVEHEHGLRGEEQTVLAMLFPGECDRCPRAATHLQRGKVWRSLCTGCAKRESKHIVSRADATALFGVDVGFVQIERKSLPQRAMHALRSFSMVVLMGVCAAFGLRAVPGAAMVVAMLLGIVTTLGLAVGVASTRAPRRREALFQLQCLCLAAASVYLAVRSH